MRHVTTVARRRTPAPSRRGREVPRPARGRSPRARGAAVLRAVLVLLLVALAAAGHAQQRFNFLAVDDQVLDAAGPYYFVAYGDSGNAFAKAGPMADAMGIDLDYDADAGQLVFENGVTTARWDVTRDVAGGLEHRTGTLTVNGEPFPRAIPSALLVDGTSYVAVTPLAEAFGGEAAWFPSGRVIRVTLPEPDPLAGAERRTPRVGLHDGYARVAIDVPADQPADLLVADGSVALRLPGLPLAATDRRPGGGPLQRVYRDTLGGDPALVLVVDHAVDDAGRGYRLGRTEDVVYVDVGPDLQGEPAAGRAPDPADPPVAAAAAPPVERRQVVVIDAGHGGHDPGTVSDWAQEKEIVLDVSLRLAERLRNAGVEVILTRDDDTFLTLQDRSTFATTDRNVFVSVHANAAPNRGAAGIETWVFGEPLDPSLIDRAIQENGGGEVGAALTAEAAEVADIAGDILRETQLNYSLNLAQLVQDEMVDATGANDRGVRKNLFYVIRNSRIPAILVELGFVSHPEEGRRLLRDDYRSDLADALADGILTFLDAGGVGGDLAAR